MHMSFLFVALGGAAGSAGRYALSLIPAKTQFPVLTLLTNILGAILIGFIAGLAEQHEEFPKNAVLFWKTGVCGGFTTFSTFSLEAYSLFEAKCQVPAWIYIALSIAGCLIGIWCGRKLAVLTCRQP